MIHNNKNNDSNLNYRSLIVVVSDYRPRFTFLRHYIHYKLTEFLGGATQYYSTHVETPGGRQALAHLLGSRDPPPIAPPSTT